MIHFLCSILLLLCHVETTANFKFTYELFKNPTQLGAWFQSSSSVTQELLRPAELLPGKKRLLEVGAGMGAVTRDLVAILRDDDSLDVVEINEVYAKHLQKSFGTHENIHITCGDILQFNSEAQYDAIICTLPLTSFTSHELELLFVQFERLVKPNGYISFVEYMLIDRFHGLFKKPEQLAALQVKNNIIHTFKERYLLVTKRVLGNLPPLYVHHLCIPKKCYTHLLST